MISIESCCKRYGPVRALDDVSFAVERGEIVGLLGHNGAGKTTMMKILTGYLEPSAGKVTVGGHDVLEKRTEVQRLIGYLPESAPLYHEMLVQDYLLMMCDLRGIPRAKRLDAIADAVFATGLQDRLTQRIGTLSKGYRQRVGLAQAILHKPDVLVLDEPTNGLDPVQILEIRALIRELAKHSTVILSTHILSEIEAVCDRVLMLVDGQLVADRKLDALLDRSTMRVVAAPADRATSQDFDRTAADALLALDGVTHVAAADAECGPEFRTFTLELADDALPGPSVAALAAAEGWRLAEMATVRPSLETVFRDLVHRHARGAAAEETTAPTRQEVQS